jgi:hypothetical protein
MNHRLPEDRSLIADFEMCSCASTEREYLVITFNYFKGECMKDLFDPKVNREFIERIEMFFPVNTGTMEKDTRCTDACPYPDAFAIRIG